MNRILALVAMLCVVPAFADDESPLIKDIRAKIKDTSKPFTMWVSFTVKKGQEEAFEKACAPCVKATNKEAGCLAYQLNQDADHPEVYVMYEKWKNLDGLIAHMKETHTQTLLKAAPQMLDGAPKIKLYVAKD